MNSVSYGCEGRSLEGEIQQSTYLVFWQENLPGILAGESPFKEFLHGITAILVHGSESLALYAHVLAISLPSLAALCPRCHQ